MIRETLGGSATNALSFYRTGSISMSERTTTGGSPSTQYGGPATPPYWLKVVRSGNSFSGYDSPDGVNWTPIGTTQTITMAQNVLIGMVVTNQSTSATATGTFDNLGLAIGSTPFVTGVFPSLGGVGTSLQLTGSSYLS